MKVLRCFYRFFGCWGKDHKGRLRNDRHESTTCWIWLKLSGWGNWDYKQMPPCGSEPCPAMAHAYGAQRLQAGNMMRAEPSCGKARHCLSHIKMSRIVYKYNEVHKQWKCIDMLCIALRSDSIFRQCVEGTPCLTRLLCHSTRCSEDWHSAANNWYNLACLQQLCCTINLWCAPFTTTQFFHARELAEPQSLQGVLQRTADDPWHQGRQHSFQCRDASYPMAGKPWLRCSVLDWCWCSFSWWWDRKAS